MNCQGIVFELKEAAATCWTLYWCTCATCWTLYKCTWTWARDFKGGCELERDHAVFLVAAEWKWKSLKDESITQRSVTFLQFIIVYEHQHEAIDLFPMWYLRWDGRAGPLPLHGALRAERPVSWPPTNVRRGGSLVKSSQKQPESTPCARRRSVTTTLCFWLVFFFFLFWGSSLKDGFEVL